MNKRKKVITALCIMLAASSPFGIYRLIQWDNETRQKEEEAKVREAQEAKEADEEAYKQAKEREPNKKSCAHKNSCSYFLFFYPFKIPDTYPTHKHGSQQKTNGHDLKRRQTVKSHVTGHKASSPDNSN